mmetsp:Transcript_324/g.601  ORF Transcript_324/g.601 Transcript_324/m.601 type:complete len:99 (+) Transcript_324:534-830(+)
MYFPKCRYGDTIPICFQDCFEAYNKCGANTELAKQRCNVFVQTGQVADETCKGGTQTDPVTGQNTIPCACFSAGSRQQSSLYTILAMSGLIGIMMAIW